MRRALSFLVALCLVLTVVPAMAESPKAVLDSMQKELVRNFENLTLPDYPKPYFISYLIRDIRGQMVAAKFGAVVLRQDERQRAIGIDLRVGSPELDNRLDPFPGFDLPYSYNALDGRAPLVESDGALRTILWSMTDREYKQAVASYLKVKAKKLVEAEDPDFTGSFSAAPPETYVGKPAEDVKDMTPYEKTVASLSSQLHSNEFIFDSSVSFDVMRQDRYFVNTEGSVQFQSTVHFSYSIQAQARAEDGSVIPHSMVFYSRTLKGLPTQKQLEAQVKIMAEELLALTKAEQFQPYSGPALLVGDTAGVFLHEALGHRLEGHRQDGDEEGGTFSGKLGEKILPDNISVWDDPGLDIFEGQEVNGHYLYDDEGVKAQKVQLVDKGKLSGFLLTRKPMKDFKNSNGHARASGTATPVARMGTLVLTSEQTYGMDEMKKMLLDKARQQGKTYAVILRRAASGATNTSSWGFQAFKGVAHLVYKVDVETGAETLVRGVELLGTPLASLMKIEAVGNDPALFNGYCGAESGYVPVSTVVPSLLLKELEFQKAPPKRERKEILPRPGL